MAHDPVLGAVGPRLRALRRQRGATLAGLSELTGISVSTLSRLESGGRKPALELLLALARAYQVPLDELVGAPAPADPRIRARPVRRNGRTLIPLTPPARRKPGEAAEFDTRTPHWFGCPGPEPAEVLVLFGPQGDHIHIRARPRNRR